MSKKYWDVIPPMKPDKRTDMVKKITDWMEKHSAEERQIMPYQMPFTRILPDTPCMHNNCPNCHGTGVGRMGACVHMMSCPCPRCSPTMMMSVTAPN